MILLLEAASGLEMLALLTNYGSYAAKAALAFSYLEYPVC